MASVAINGLGRVGRAALKIIEGTGSAEVVAVNDLIPPDNLAYLVRYDTVYGHWQRLSRRPVTRWSSGASGAGARSAGSRPSCCDGMSA